MKFTEGPIWKFINQPLIVALIGLTAAPYTFVLIGEAYRDATIGDKKPWYSTMFYSTSEKFRKVYSDIEFKNLSTRGNDGKSQNVILGTLINNSDYILENAYIALSVYTNDGELIHIAKAHTQTKYVFPGIEYNFAGVYYNNQHTANLLIKEKTSRTLFPLRIKAAVQGCFLVDKDKYYNLRR